MKKSLLFCFIFLSVLNAAAQLYYKYPIVNYTPKNYGEKQNAQTWAVTQSQEGLIYVGSSNGLIEYDGYKWNFLPAQSGFVHSIACDSSNVLFVGGDGYFGRYIKDSLGRLQYDALSENLLPKDHIPFTKIWRTFAGSDKIYFQSYEAIFIYDYKSIKVIKPETSFHLASFCNNQFYVRERQKGLMKLEGEKLSLIPNSLLFAEYGVFSIQAFDDKKQEVLLVTQEQGLFIFNTQTNTFRPYITQNNAIWYNTKLLGCIRLKNGNYAFNSQLYGTILFNPQTQDAKFISSAIGLQDDYVIAQFEDNNGNLWMALNSGISKANIQSPLQSYTSMKGSVNDVVKFNNQIYAATPNGIFIKPLQSADFILDYNFNPQTVWQFAINNNKLYVATDKGIYEHDGRFYKKLIDGNFRKIKFLSNGKVLVGGTSDVGLSIYSKSFKEEYNFIFEITGDILGIEEEVSTDKTTHIYWASTNTALYKITDDGTPVFKVDTYGEDFGLPKDWKYPFLFNSKIVVGNHSGLYELKKDNKGVFFDAAKFYDFESTQTDYSFIKDYPDKTIAIIDNKPIIIYKKNNQKIDNAFFPINMGKENVLYYDNKELYIGLAEGLVIFNESKNIHLNKTFDIVLRKLNTKNDSVLFEGAKKQNHLFAKELNFNFNELNIEFSANYFYEEDKTLYRYRLEGIDADFSNWQAERKIKLNNLHEGSYKLIIQAKNIYEQQSNDLIIEFKVLPPWYRTTLAYVFYLIGFILIVFVAIKIASYRLQQQNKILDNLVKQRTKEIENKNIELNKQNIQILHQKQEITDSINYAKRIQNAILPPLAEIKNSWNDVFIFFQPKDIVSGDFYWFHKINESEFLIASADCTGHGVPGGFMSMVCSDKLNEAVTLTNEPDTILKIVNRRIKQSLRQDNKEGSTKDGMEIALIKVNTKTKAVKYAGANRFLWIIRKDSDLIEEIKPTKAGIGGHTNDTQEFALHQLQFQTGDRLYMSTDGYGDQFGGAEGKKLMTKNFKHFLLEIKNLAIDDQGTSLEKHINSWKNNYEQVDDILVIGVKL